MLGLLIGQQIYVRYGVIGELSASPRGSLGRTQKPSIVKIISYEQEELTTLKCCVQRIMAAVSDGTGHVVTR